MSHQCQWKYYRFGAKFNIFWWWTMALFCRRMNHIHSIMDKGKCRSLMFTTQVVFVSMNRLATSPSILATSTCCITFNTCHVRMPHHIPCWIPYLPCHSPCQPPHAMPHHFHVIIDTTILPHWMPCVGYRMSLLDCLQEQSPTPISFNVTICLKGWSNGRKLRTVLSQLRNQTRHAWTSEVLINFKQWVAVKGWVGGRLA